MLPPGKATQLFDRLWTTNIIPSAPKTSTSAGEPPALLKRKVKKELNEEVLVNVNGVLRNALPYCADTDCANSRTVPSEVLVVNDRPLIWRAETFEKLEYTIELA